MRRYTIILFLLLAPTFAQAACSNTGYTVVFINGVFDTEKQAYADKQTLQDHLKLSFDGENVSYVVGYNASHLAGLSDLFDSYFPTADQYDLQTILMQLQNEVQTRKILIVGHSQGAIYANEVYEYLIAHGVSTESVAVYAVATPDSYVAGNGLYRNYALDSVLNYLEVFPRFKLMPYNLDSLAYVNSNGDDLDPRHHSFSGTYLALFSDKLVPDMQSELAALKAGTSTQDACFEAPSASTAYIFQKGAFTTADPIAVAIKSVGTGAYSVASALVSVTNNLAISAFKAIGFGTHTSQPATAKVDTDKGLTDAGIALLNALNLTTLTPKVANDLGGAAILAVKQDESAATSSATSTGEVLGEETTVPSVPITQLVATPIVGAGGGGGSSAPSGSGGGAVSTTPSDESTTDTTVTNDVTDATSTESTTTPAALAAPQHVVFSNWASPPVTDTYCNVMTRSATVAWDAVPGAVGYQIWQSDNSYGDRIVADTASTSVTNLAFQFGLDWGTQIALTVVAYDSAGQFASTSVDEQSMLPDRDSPTIETLTPAVGATDVPISTPLTITYNEPLDPSTVTNSTVGISHIFDGPPVSGPLWEPLDASVTLESDGKTVTITPSAPLVAGQRYSMAASCAVKDLYGNHGGVLSFWTDHPQFMVASAPIDVPVVVEATTTEATTTDTTTTEVVQ